MSSRQKTMDFLFGVQVLYTLLFGGSQFIRMLTTSNGVSISWLVCWEAFLVINLILALQAHRIKRSRITAQTVFGYIAWMVIIGLDLGVLLWKNIGTWNERDTATSILVGLAIIVISIFVYCKNLSFSNPLIKGSLAIFFKGIPQLVLAYNIYMLGNEGLTLVAIIGGHVTILIRIIQLRISSQEVKTDKNRTGSFISEIANETSWLVVTLVWIIK